MKTIFRRIERSPRQAGFTLAEVLAACFIIGVGLVAAAAGFVTGVQGVEAGRQQTTASFLAEQRMEQIKATAMANFANVTNANFPNEAYGSIPNATGFRRTVNIVDNPAGLANTKRVDISVFWNQVGGYGQGERRVDLSIILTLH